MSTVTEKPELFIKATHGSEERPLKIGDAAMPCYVLSDARRVITQTGIIEGIGISYGSGPERLASFLGTAALKPFVAEWLADRIKNPVRFSLPRGGLAYGFEATTLVDICEAVLSARDAGKLHQQQKHIARQCDRLLRGFARVGIVALVDEATGYQEDRAKEELQTKLAAYLADEMRPWERFFPSDFWVELARLTNWKKSPDQRPKWWGKLVTEFVYDTLDPDVAEWLKVNKPKPCHGRNWHQWFSKDYGVRKLELHIHEVLAVARCSRDVADLRSRMRAIYGGRMYQNILGGFQAHQLN